MLQAAQLRDRIAFVWTLGRIAFKNLIPAQDNNLEED
jgi:hypothetical protein